MPPPTPERRESEILIWTRGGTIPQICVSWIVILLPVREMRNWNRKMNPLFIPFTIPLIAILVLIPQKYLSGPESQFLRIRIVPPLIWTQSVLSKSKCSLVEKLVEKKTFNKILIANRGEVAFRIIRSARRIGINGLNEYATLLL